MVYPPVCYMRIWGLAAVVCDFEEHYWKAAALWFLSYMAGLSFLLRFPIL